MSTVRSREQRSGETAGNPPSSEDAALSDPTTSRVGRRRLRSLAVTGMAICAAGGVALAVTTAEGHLSGNSGSTAAAPTSSPNPSQLAAAKARAEPIATATSTTTSGNVIVHVTSIGELAKNHRSVRVYSALMDLSNTGEMKWRADDGHAVGDAFCTQNYRFNPSGPSGTRPTMLLCWRTSVGRSSYALTVSVDTPPSEQETVTLVDHAWAALG